MKAIAVFLTACVVSFTAGAKLPAPDAAAQAKAAEAKAKAAHKSKVEAYELCKAQDKAVNHYRRTSKKAKPGVATPACAKPAPM